MLGYYPEVTRSFKLARLSDSVYHYGMIPAASELLHHPSDPESTGNGQAVFAALEAMLAHSRDLVLLVDDVGRIGFAAGYAALLGQKPAALRNRELAELLPPGTSLELARYCRDELLPCQLESICFLRLDGDLVELSLTIDRAGQGLLGALAGPANWLLTLRDTASERDARERAVFYERYDSLTRLYNRSSLLQQLATAVTVARSRQRLFCVIAIGLDRFKRINDLYGTERGDAVLVAVAEQLQKVLRDGDVLARFRGDKFFAICQDIRSHEDVKSILAKIRQALDFSLPVPASDVKLSASVGIAFYPNDGLEPHDLVRNAEMAMYMAKELGRDSYRLYDARMNEALLDRQRIERELDQAIRQSQFLPYFQPKVDLHGRLVGAEALIRWPHADGKIRSPGYFIPYAEANGSIDEIGRIMLGKTCSILASYRESGILDVPVSINLSPRQFSQASLLVEVGKALSEHRLPPELIEFEITESCIMENERAGIDKLGRLKAMGVSISIDDFGSGYSSFSKLKDYPIDIIKMDKAFIDPLPWDHRAAVIASAIIDLAHTLGCKVVAEGVETPSQLDFLSTVACDSYQGYLFSRPRPPEQFEQLLRSGLPLPAQSAEDLQ